MKFPTLEGTYKFFGENENSATLMACSIAAFKGLFRPMFTMMDKKSDPQTKKYAAVREFLTEVAALPLYAITPYLVGKAVDRFAKGTEAAKKTMKVNAKFLGICAATLIIPAVCNAIQPPAMKIFKKYQDTKKAKIGLDVNVGDATSNTIQKPTAANSSATNKPYQTATLPINKVNSGMKVGG